MDFLKAGQKLRLVPDEISQLSEGVITEVNKDAFIVETLNLSSDKLTPESNLEVICPSDNCLVRFESRILKIEHPNKIWLSLPQKIRYIQRREYTRIDIALPVRVFLNENSEEFFEALSRNISGGGIQFSSNLSLEIKSGISISFVLPGKQEIKAKLEVLRSGEIPNSQEWLISGQFSEISNFDRTTLVQLCFKRKLELNCKDLN
jgi:c-di-GMP-binding flagellar brake protein YcgR